MVSGVQSLIQTGLSWMLWSHAANLDLDPTLRVWLISLLSWLMLLSSTGVIPVVPAIYSHNSGALPIFYDSPACESVVESLLDCPREWLMCPGQEKSMAWEDQGMKQLGRLSQGAAMVGSRALPGVVGVKCPTEGSYL